MRGWKGQVPVGTSGGRLHARRFPSCRRKARRKSEMHRRQEAHAQEVMMISSTMTLGAGGGRQDHAVSPAVWNIARSKKVKRPAQQKAAAAIFDVEESWPSSRTLKNPHPTH